MIGRVNHQLQSEHLNLLKNGLERIKEKSQRLSNLFSESIFDINRRNFEILLDNLIEAESQILDIVQISLDQQKHLSILMNLFKVDMQPVQESFNNAAYKTRALFKSYTQSMDSLNSLEVELHSCYGDRISTYISSLRRILLSIRERKEIVHNMIKRNRIEE